MKTIGLLAAFGPVAGAHFYTRLLELVDAKGDADYPGIVLLSRPDIPDRIEYLLHDGPSPVPHFIEMARQLDALNVDLVAIASATSHAFLADVEKACRAPAVNLLAAVGAEVAMQGARRVGCWPHPPAFACTFTNPTCPREACWSARPTPSRPSSMASSMRSSAASPTLRWHVGS